MKTYEVNKAYTLHVDCIREMNDGRKYIYFTEAINGKPLRVRAFGFLAEPGEELPGTIDVVVKGIDPMNGLPVLMVEKDWLINTLYRDENLPKKFAFTVVNKINDIGGSRLSLKDKYGVSHIFPLPKEDSLENYSIGDRIGLIAEKIGTNANGKKYLHLYKPASNDPITQYIHVFTTRDSIDTPEVKTAISQAVTFGEESDILEFKQSLVFDPEKSSVNVDKQVFNIMRSIAGFMNNKGGTLYIGVKDDGTVKGVESDYPHLNEGTSGFGNYTDNWDGWGRKLIDSIRESLGKFAASLVSVEKMEHDGLTYAKITAQKALKPIYVDNKKLFLRQCNTTSQLYGDELTWFIVERMQGEALEKLIEEKQAFEPEVIEDTDTAKEEVITTATPADITSAAKDDRNQNNWYYLRFFADGHYIGTKPTANIEAYDAKLVCDYQLKQYHKHEDQVLLMIYNGSCKVNKIDFDKGTNNWYGKDKKGVIEGTNTTNAPWIADQQMEVKCVDRNDMLVAFYKLDDKTYCYVRDIADIDPSQTNRERALFTGGSRMVPDKAELIGEIKHLSGAYRNWIAPIVNKKNLEIEGSKMRATICRLIKILEEVYPIESR